MSVTEKAKQNDWHERLASAREILQPSEVELHRVPNWLRRRMLKVYGCRDGDTSGFGVLQNAVAVHFGDNFWLDHWGTTDGGRVFASEPYQVNAITVALLDSFAKRLEISWCIEANSWWNPGSTIRLSFFKREEGEDAEAEAIEQVDVGEVDESKLLATT